MKHFIHSTTAYWTPISKEICRILTGYTRGLPAFSTKDQIANLRGFCGAHRSALNYSILSLQFSYRQYLNKWAWLCFSETLFIQHAVDQTSWFVNPYIKQKQTLTNLDKLGEGCPGPSTPSFFLYMLFSKDLMEHSANISQQEHPKFRKSKVRCSVLAPLRITWRTFQQFQHVWGQSWLILINIQGCKRLIEKEGCRIVSTFNNIKHDL